jgi:hypothetical protein
MTRLSGLDNLFVMLDSERYPLHAAAIFVLDPSTAPKPFTFEVLRAHIAHLIPVLSRCVPQNPQQVRAVRPWEACRSRAGEGISRPAVDDIEEPARVDHDGTAGLVLLIGHRLAR